MKAWRIKKCSNSFNERYILQRRLFGFLWWHNPDNIDGAITGVYDTLEEAKDAYRRKVEPDVIEIIEI